ncbi:MAG TPA: tyrosinase family protein [Xanthobacteraceae bacterium]|nr:tyrosinase family protein [Xanthobacteraceae bacterium]
MTDASNRHGTSRRSLLKLGAALGATALVPARSASAQTPSVRPDIASPAGTRMAGLYAQAVQKMQDPAINIPPQPHSWTFQSYIHGVPKDPFHPVESDGLRHGTAGLSARVDLIYSNPAQGTPQAAWKKAALECWGTCPHGSPWFVAWHRWYVFYFEKIVRLMSGANDFVLPYWNYASDQGPSLQLPAAFQDSNSALYEDLRGLGFANPAGTGNQNVPMNMGGYMPYSQTDYGPALQAMDLFPSDTNFVLPPDPRYYAFGLTGRLEVQPHDNVHDNIGGIMSNVPVAAGDPIFFVHHCQIDRLWAAWQAAPGSVYNWGATPTEPSQFTWEGRKFMFVDETNKLVMVSTAGQLSTKEMGYAYDSLPPRPAGPVVAAARGASPPVQLAAARGSGLTVGSAGGRLTLSPGPPSARATGPRAAQERATLVLSKVKLISRPPAPLHVFLNLPEGTAPALDSPYHVGVLSFFMWDKSEGGPMIDLEGGHSMSGADEFTFAVGEILARQKAENLWSGGAVTVTVTTLGADKSSGRTYVTIGEIELLP